ncbi:PadR family transcriptional regulator [Sphingomonas sp.]|uniref:PadR family transcriptional regulator n=1 Tax=Sphingomonas sp. TaxID=28214 RepID=UPI0031E1B039
MFRFSHGGGRHHHTSRHATRPEMDVERFFHWIERLNDGDTRRRGGGRSRRMFDGGELRLVLLKLIADEPRHGYDLIREIETMTGGAYAPSPGVIYPTITLLDEMGFIEEQQSAGSKKRFAVTEQGRTHLSENAEQVDALIARLLALGEQRERVDAAPIRRAMGGLKMALGERFGRGNASQDMMHEVAAMIDELAQKVERMK